MRELLQEIQRRNVSKVALVYIIAGWLTMQVVDVMFPALKLPEWLTTAIAALLLIGFPFAVIFAWAFELTPEGIKREKDVDRSQSITGETGKKLNRSIIVVLVVAVGFLLIERFVLHNHSDDEATAVAPAEIKPSIAVLPFINMSGDEENEYFSDGLSEELLNVLAKIPKLHVAGRTSSFQFKGENQDLRNIGQLLNVANVLEGSVRQSGTRLRITAQLIDTETGYHLWSETYDREITDVFAIQDEIAGNVVNALRVALLGEEDALIDHGTENLEAYNLYLQAQYFWDRPSADNLNKAQESLEAAIELDPEYAQAYAMLAHVYSQVISGIAGLGTDDFIREFKVVHEYADKAMELAPELPEALVAKGMALSQAEWKHLEGIEYFEEVLALAPNNMPALGWLGGVRVGQRRFDEAIALAQKQVSIDPLSVIAYRNLGDAFTRSGRLDEAIDSFNNGLRIQPDSARLNARIARVHFMRGDYETAAEYAALEPVEWVRDMYDVLLIGRGENSEEFRAAAKAYEEKYGTPNSYQLAEIYGSVGDVENAIKWLEMCHEVHDPGIIWLDASNFLEPARSDPRWPKLVKLAGF